MTKHPPVVVIKNVKDELGITYEEMAARIRKRTKRPSPVGAFLNQLALGVKRCSPDMAVAIEKTFPEKIRREDLIWPSGFKKASNG
jgi:hypothetical protein